MLGIHGPGFDAYRVINGGAHAVFAAEVTFGRLNGYVPAEKLNLLQFAARSMAQSRACPAEVVWSEPIDARFTGVFAYNVPNGLLGQAVTPGLSIPVYSPEQFASCQLGGVNPVIEHILEPARIGTVLVWPALPNQIDDCPVVFALLYVPEFQVPTYARRLRSPGLAHTRQPPLDPKSDLPEN